MVDQKFAKHAGPQNAILGTLDTAVPTMADDTLPFIQGGIGKKVAISGLIDGATGTATSTGLTNADGVISVDIAGLDAKATPIAADSVMLCDSADTNALKEATITGLAKPLADIMAGVAATTGLSDDGAGVLTVAAKIAHLEAALLKGTTPVRMSFEANEKTTTKIYFPMKVTVNKIRGIAMKAIAGTDNGTVTCGNSTGASATGEITATASDAIDTEYSVTPTTNNVVLADGYYYLTSAKSTSGGVVLVTLEWTRTA